MDVATLSGLPVEYLPIALVGIIVYQILKLVLPYFRKKVDCKPDDTDKTDAIG